MVYYERNLPHYQPEGYAYFITTRLARTIPKEVYERIKKEYKSKLEKINSYENKKDQKEKYLELQRYNFKKYERILDSCKYGYKWLGNKEIANVVKEALHHKDGKLYDLIAYTIMLNHIHIVFKPIVERASARFGEAPLKQQSDINVALQNKPIADIMRLIKGATAYKANIILKRKGNFWQHENYDHVIRDQKELRRIVKYILNDPVKAGLCEDAYKWKWNYFNPKYFT